MPLFLSEEELRALSHDAAAVADRADAAIRDLRRQLDTVKAEADAAAIASEQTCAILEQRYAALSADLDLLRSENAQLAASSDHHVSALAQAQADKHQLHLKAIAKDGDIERLTLELADLQRSKRHSLDLLQQKDAEITEKNTTIQAYLDKIVVLTDKLAAKETGMQEIQIEFTRCRATCNRISQEKELLEKHNSWLDEELKAKSNTLSEMRKSNMNSESKMSARIGDLERELSESLASLKRRSERVAELEQRVSYLEKELSTSKEAAATNEQRLNAELTTVSKLVELYKESSVEWSKKAGELEGVIKALEAHLTQVEEEYKEKLEKEVSIRSKLEKEAAEMREKLEKLEIEIENARKNTEQNLLPVTSGSTMQELVLSDSGMHREGGDDQMIVPKIPPGISGTALAASLLREGWSLAKMYEQYQDAADALRHERWGRKHAEAVLERVLREIEQKAELILDERAEHERMVEAYSLLNQKLEQALLEHESFENTIRSLKSELKRLERDNNIAQKEINDLTKQVAVLLKECQDIQIRCGGSSLSASLMGGEGGVDLSDSPGQMTFKDISGLVEQNVVLQSQVQRLSAELEKKDEELKEGFEIEKQKLEHDGASKIEAVLKRLEEQQCMIETLHTSVAMYKRLYEEERKSHSSGDPLPKGVPDGNGDIVLRIENVQTEASKNENNQLLERSRKLEEELTALRSEITALRLERDKMALEAEFSKERLNSSIMELEHQRKEANAVSARNVELTHLIVDYQKRLRESSDSVQTAEENARKFSMEISILKHEKEIVVNSEKRAIEEVHDLSDKVHRLQSTLDTLQATEEVRENARASEKQKQADYIKRLEQEWAEAKKEVQEERDRVRTLAVEKERTIETSMKQVEEMRKELSDAWRAVSSAETRAAIAEAKCSDLDGKSGGKDGRGNNLMAAANVVDNDLWKAKEELEKLREDAQANKNYMLQYKEIAQTNEAALKQMESVHEEYKEEAEKSKKSLEDEVASLRSKLSELEEIYQSKCQEAASAIEEKDKQLFSLGLDISVLKDEITEKSEQIEAVQIHVSSLKEELDREHKRWRTAQDNYERQVVMQAETIQELTNTSKELSVLQNELARLRENLDAQKTENEILKASLEHEKLKLQKERDEALRKYNETNEQNKLLHSRLESLHVRLADKEQSSSGYSVDSKAENDLHNVISYLRRSKEIAETEISLLKQEKSRLQSELDIAVKASQDAQAMLRSHVENARANIFKDEEFKSLQLQVREINLLRESNIQLREENKQNFEECQKLREEAQKAKVEAESSRSLLAEKQIELEKCQKELDLKRIEAENLNNRIKELVESSKNIDPKEHERIKVEFHHIKMLLDDNYKELEQAKNQILEKEQVVLKLEENLAKCQADLAVRENKLNEVLQVEASLRAEIERHKRFNIGAKRKSEALLLKEREDFNKEREGYFKDKEGLIREKEGLLKQIEELKSILAGRKSMGESSTDQAAKEKDTRIQMLERTLERERQEKEKEKTRRKNGELIVKRLYDNVQMDKKKVEDELAKHKKHVAVLLESSALAASQMPSQVSLDEQTIAYFSSVTTLESSASSLQEGQGGLSAISETSNAEALQASARQATPAPPARTVTPPAKVIERRMAATSVVSRPTEVRKPGRRLVRPALERTEQPQTDTEMPAAETGATTEEIKTGTISQATETPSASSSLVRKRGLSSEPREEPGTQEIAADLSEDTVPPQKKHKETDVSQETTQDSTESTPAPVVPAVPASPEISEVMPELVIPADNVDAPGNAEEMDADQPGGEEIIEATGEEDSTNKDDMDLEEKSQEEEEQQLETDATVIALEEGEAAQNLPSEGEEDREEGELPEDQDQAQDDIPGEDDNPETTPTRTDEMEETLEPASPEPATELGEITEERNEGAEIVDEGPKSNEEAPPVVAPVVQKRIVRLRGSSSSSVRNNTESSVAGGLPAAENQGLGTPPAETEASDGASRAGRTIRLSERARENAALRQARILQPQPAGRGRGQGSRGTRTRGHGAGR
ncbi:Nuclear-pore anchor [Rhynchospora pubera]|uniref:Nuclear-pore anchor n=1 Tax=Rhynchospora pubera TaxID=906938 RepID=A0AAV8CM68_9POAL|nr:Nuclear-pore anchor [Rhynchospora pubera]